MRTYLSIPLAVIVLGLSACTGSDQTRTENTVSVGLGEQKVPLTKPSCSDVLSTWKTKPDNLDFLGCTDGKSAQIDTLVYSYSVVGSKAKPVEKLLGEKYAMAPLAFVCCGWEPRLADGSSAGLGNFRNSEGFYYQISMGSGETVEKDWSKIPTFQVTVELFLDVV